MAIEAILNALPKYKKYGKKFRAPCVVHDGKDFNLMISERSDGSVGCYCFVCHANGLDVVDALGVNRSELFPPDSEYKRQPVTNDMRDKYAQDAMVLAMAEKAPEGSLTLADKRRIKLAKGRMEGIEQLMGNTGEQ